MSIPLKKQFSTYRIVQAVTAFVYLFVTLAVPLIHTCGPCETSSRCCRIEINTDAQLEISPKKDGHKAKTLSHSDICTACLYSITSKFTQAKVKTTLINITTVRPSPIPFTAGVAKQSEWLTSVSLRAPPVI
jgi:hypothetical protein